MVWIAPSKIPLFKKKEELEDFRIKIYLHGLRSCQLIRSRNQHTRTSGATATSDSNQSCHSSITITLFNSLLILSEDVELLRRSTDPRIWAEKIGRLSWEIGWFDPPKGWIDSCSERRILPYPVCAKRILLSTLLFNPGTQSHILKHVLEEYSNLNEHLNYESHQLSLYGKLARSKRSHVQCLSRLYEMSHFLLNVKLHSGTPTSFLSLMTPFHLCCMHMGYELNPSTIWATVIAKSLLGTFSKLLNESLALNTKGSDHSVTFKASIEQLNCALGPATLFHILGTMLTFPRLWMECGACVSLINGGSSVFETRPISALETILLETLQEPEPFSSHIHDQHPYLLAFLALRYPSFMENMFAYIERYILDSVHDSISAINMGRLNYKNRKSLLEENHIHDLNKLLALFAFFPYILERQRLDSSAIEHHNPVSFIDSMWQKTFQKIRTSNLANDGHCSPSYIYLKNTWLSYFVSAKRLCACNSL